MSKQVVSLAIRNYDHLWPLAMGDVGSDVIDLRVERSSDALYRVRDAGIDGGEISLSRHIQRLSRGEPSPWVEIPAYVMRGFTQRCVFVRSDSDLHDASQLAGKRIGTNEWPATGNSWTRAMMRERGVPLTAIQWFVGRISSNYKAPPSDRLPENVTFIDTDVLLVDKLIAGELDALMCPWPPAELYRQEGLVRRLYPDFRQAEREYFRRTRVYPVRHMIGVRRDLAERRPDVVRATYDTLDASRRECVRAQNEMPESPPWAMAEWEETEALMGPEFQSYGLGAANLKMLAVFCEELFEQGFLLRRVAAEEVFAEWEEYMAGSQA